jgi:hypothetical protein
LIFSGHNPPLGMDGSSYEQGDLWIADPHLRAAAE